MIKIVQGLAIVHPQPLNDFYHHSFSFRESREKCVFATSPLNYPQAHLCLRCKMLRYGRRTEGSIYIHISRQRDVPVEILAVDKLAS